METHLYPSAFARFYDLIYQSIRHDTDSAFFLKKIRESKGPVLEVGTGTGRFLKEALDAGADIYGIDVSPAMVEVLQKKLNPADHFRVTVADLRTFRLDKKFDLVIAPFRVFGHLLTPEDQLMAFERIHEHLAPGGRLIFDLFVPDPVILSKGFVEYCDFEGEYEPGRKVRRITNAKPDIINQVMQVTFRLEWEEDSGIKSESWYCPVRFYFRWELEHLVARSKLKLEEILGDYEGHPLQEGSREFIVICS
jgi:SAM-dependent methyltransferase